MKTFLLKGKSPIIKWGMLPDNIFFEGEIPDGYNLAVTPSKGYIVIDVDKHKGNNGFKNIPSPLMRDLKSTFNYATKNNGRHFWFKYTGDKVLANKASKYSIDLRTHKGYVVFYPRDDIRTYMRYVNESSIEMNKWLETLFSYV